MTKTQLNKWKKKHPIGTSVLVKAKNYVIEEYGSFKRISQDNIEASVIISGPFQFCDRWAVKLVGFQNQPIFISRLEAI